MTHDEQLAITNPVPMTELESHTRDVELNISWQQTIGSAIVSTINDGNIYGYDHGLPVFYIGLRFAGNLDSDEARAFSDHALDVVDAWGAALGVTVKKGRLVEDNHLGGLLLQVLVTAPHREYCATPDVCIREFPVSQTGRTFWNILPAAIQSHEKIARYGWNGKDQFVIKAGGYTVNEVRPGSDYARAGVEVPFIIAPHLDLRNAQGVMQPGWAPSQGDLFATDWYIIKRTTQ